jgi:hypothetical protein
MVRVSDHVLLCVVSNNTPKMRAQLLADFDFRSDSQVVDARENGVQIGA